VHVQALVSKGSVERFNEAIVRWLAGPAEVDPDSMMIRPEIEDRVAIDGMVAFRSSS
jgi:hypothetical protein